MPTHKANKVPADLLREAEKAQKEGTALPSGVSFNYARNPQIMLADDIESMGEIDNRAVDTAAVRTTPVEGHSDQ